MRSATGSGARLLLIESDPTSSRTIARDLTSCLGNRMEIAQAHSGRAALTFLREKTCAVVLIDLKSASDLAATTEEVISRLSRIAKGALVIALSNGTSVSLAVAAMRAGAHDYIPKPLCAEALADRLDELALRHGKATAKPLNTSRHNASADFEGFIGISSQMRVVYEQIGRIASSSAPVFITGESGTGKEVCAQALHCRGSRAKKPIIAINCGAIPHDLMEAELFGVAQGAYTGALEDRKGAAEMADGGTLFLDEIGELDLSLQTKLLRFLQTSTITRLGEVTVRHLDVRVICATNHNPMQLIAEKRFREDLFYRLHVLPIHLPPLRQRPSDILPLSRSFLERYANEEKKSFEPIGPEIADLLVTRDWPGNIRQLQNLIRRIVVMFDGGEIVPQMVAAADIESHAILKPAVAARAFNEQKILPMWQQEQRIIEDTITHFKGNISRAAAALEISPSTIYRKRQTWEQMGRENVMVGAA